MILCYNTIHGSLLINVFPAVLCLVVCAPVSNVSGMTFIPVHWRGARTIAWLTWVATCGRSVSLSQRRPECEWEGHAGNRQGTRAKRDVIQTARGPQPISSEQQHEATRHVSRCSISLRSTLIECYLSGRQQRLILLYDQLASKVCALLSRLQAISRPPAPGLMLTQVVTR